MSVLTVETETIKQDRVPEVLFILILIGMLLFAGNCRTTAWYVELFRAILLQSQPGRAS